MQHRCVALVSLHLRSTPFNRRTPGALARRRAARHGSARWPAAILILPLILAGATGLLGVPHVTGAPVVIGLAGPPFYGTAIFRAKDGNLYGFDSGGIYELVGTNFNVLHSFTGPDDGAGPAAMIQASDGNFYGVTGFGGAYSNGIVFAFSPGGAFTTLYSFSGGNDGGSPDTLMQGADGNLYGTTTIGGNGGNGTVFCITTGGALTTLGSFAVDGSQGFAGFRGYSTLVWGGDGRVYGAARYGGADAQGAIFAASTYENSNRFFGDIYSFTGGADGENPVALAVGSDGQLYGLTDGGDANDFGRGMAFRINLSHDSLQRLQILNPPVDGGEPMALVAADDGNLYGIASIDGPADGGTVFEVTTNGTFSVISSFASLNNQGAYYGNPISLNLGSDGNLYGASEYSGFGGGGVFEVLIAPPAIQSPVASNGSIRFDIPTVAGTGYTVEQSASLENPDWTDSATFVGDGSMFPFSAPLTNSAEFFRVIAGP